MKIDQVRADISEVLYTRVEVEARIKELAKQITQDYQGKELILICILKGGVFALNELILNLNMHVQIDFMTVSSYANSTSSSGNVKIVLDLAHDIAGQDVLVIEDIIDTGLTLTKIVEYLENKKPRSVELFTLLRKPEATIFPINVKYVGFDIPNKFVVGYGFDYDQMYRNLDVIGVLNPEVYEAGRGRNEVYARAGVDISSKTQELQ
ncbi:MAG: hypoxanthine phosphoribosyltransferase [Bifidobacteriaceae bacterium]|jgi:hypoxanthine phosphoribosyltransferase|nr:hypoxanthine phosphoribosyltransferase [Bifidobacteriaceae bacterium]